MGLPSPRREEEAALTHIEILEAIAQCYGRPRFLEIGTGDGGCFARVARHCSVAVTVDVPENPHGNSEGDVPHHYDAAPRVEYWGGGSDDYFAGCTELFDLIFIDGSHWYDQVRRDFLNAVEALAPLGTVALHDTWAATRDEASQGSDDAYLLAEEVESDPAFQAYTLPVRPGLTLARPSAPRFE